MSAFATNIATHTLNGDKFDPYVYCANSGDDDLQIPETDTAAVGEFRTACGIRV